MSYVTANEEVLNTLKAVPNLSVHELSELLPHIKKQTVYATVSYLYRKGTLHVTSTSQKVAANNSVRVSNHYSINPNPVPLPPKRKLKSPTPSGYEAQIADLKEKLAELEQWKANAIERFPDLAVEPTLLRARKIVADELRAGGDNILAEQVLSGKKDHSIMVRVTVKALEEGE